MSELEDGILSARHDSMNSLTLIAAVYGFAGVSSEAIGEPLSSILTVATIVIALLGLGVSWYTYVRTGSSRALSRIHLRGEEAKLHLIVLRDKLVSFSKEMDEARHESSNLSSLQSKTLGIRGLGKAWLMKRLLQAYTCYPMISTIELSDLFLDDALFEDEHKVRLAINQIDAVLATL